MTTQKRWALVAISFLLAAIATFILISVFRSNSNSDEYRRPVPPGTDVPISERLDTGAGDEFFVRLEQTEARLRDEKSPLEIERIGRTLTIRGRKNSVTLKDCLDCGPDKDIEYYAVERSHDPLAVLVYQQMYEGDGYLLITEDGTQFELPSYPVFSPNKKAFIVVSAAEAFNWNGIEIWENGGQGFELKLRYEPETYELYRFLGWAGNERARLEFSHYARNDESTPSCRAAEIVKTGKTWKRRLLKEARDGFCSDSQEWLPELLRR